MNKILNTMFKCEQCEEMWSMYSIRPPHSPWCPFCGYSENELGDKRITSDSKTNVEPKTEEQLLGEDEINTKMCVSKGGWWNPITNTCMGT